MVEVPHFPVESKKGAASLFFIPSQFYFTIMTSDLQKKFSKLYDSIKQLQSNLSEATASSYQLRLQLETFSEEGHKDKKHRGNNETSISWLDVWQQPPPMVRQTSWASLPPIPPPPSVFNVPPKKIESEQQRAAAAFERRKRKAVTKKPSDKIEVVKEAPAPVPIPEVVDIVPLTPRELLDDPITN